MLCPDPETAMSMCLGPDGCVAACPGPEGVVSTCPGPEGVTALCLGLHSVQSVWWSRGGPWQRVLGIVSLGCRGCTSWPSGWLRQRLLLLWCCFSPIPLLGCSPCSLACPISRSWNLFFSSQAAIGRQVSGVVGHAPTSTAPAMLPVARERIRGTGSDGAGIPRGCHGWAARCSRPRARHRSCPSPSWQVESSDTPKDIAAVPKCPPPCPEASPAEPLPNGDLEADGAQWKGAEEGGTSPKGGRQEEDETESLPDGETGRALENGRCTPKEGLDAPADEGELAPSDPQKKRGRRKLLEAAEKSKT